jgi:hypothetical protein
VCLVRAGCVATACRPNYPVVAEYGDLMSNFFGRVVYNCKTAAGECGISETYPIVADDYVTAGSSLADLVTKRLDMMVADCQVAYAGVSDSDIIGDFAPSTTLVDNPGSYASTEDDATGPFDAVRLARFSDEAWLHRCIRKVGLLPVSQFNGEDLVFVPSGTWLANYATWRTAVTSTCCIATKDPTAVVPPFYTFTPMAHSSDERNSFRKVGRPFGLLVGRRVIR